MMRWKWLQGSKFGMQHSPNDKTVLESSELAQSLILKLRASNPTHETFDQVGLLDGHEIVKDYIDHGELGCALHHLLYMIHESDIPFPRKTMLALHQLADEIGERNHYSKENQKNLTPEQRKQTYNAP